MDNIGTYHQACMSRYASQEADRREMSTKTLGILTFCAAVFGVSLSLIEGIPEGGVLNSFIVMTSALAFAIVLSLLILMPGKWRQQFELSEVRGLLGHEHKDFILAMADECRRATEYNRPKLDKNACMIQALIAVAIIEFVAFACFVLLFIFSSAPQQTV